MTTTITTVAVTGMVEIVAVTKISIIALNASASTASTNQLQKPIPARRIPLGNASNQPGKVTAIVTT